MSITIEIQSNGLAAARRQLLQLERPDYMAELLESVGALVESQTRRRIQEEKTGPDGEAWAEWSERYARTRHGGQSLLQGEGDLLDSIQYLVSGDTVEIGSNLIYAGVQQEGYAKKNLPARPYLGLSPENEAELDLLIADMVQGLI